MMTRKRSKIEIYVEILRVLKSGVNKPTNIMYKCNLAWAPFKKILETLVNIGLIKTVERGTRKTFAITEKGQEFLKQFELAETVLIDLRKTEKNNNALDYGEKIAIFCQKFSKVPLFSGLAKM
ncbi:hypothetical protein KEJ18_02295 [Candidatus Bathyarchaeota archaeon]|nr:hypothetical protein [Candidatus Bathyarchaeota archaeon]